jgi:hypothetical protein
MRIRIQIQFQIQGFDDQKLGKICSWIFLLIPKPKILDPDPDPATQSNANPCGSGYASVLGYSDNDVFLENDEGSRVYRCKKLF